MKTFLIHSMNSVFGRWLKDLNRYNANRAVYGADKVWRQLRREGVEVARCTVERLMRAMNLRGAARGGAFKVTTVSGDESLRPKD